MHCVGKENVLDYLINELDQDPVAKDKDGLTTVHAATQNERASTVKVRRGNQVYIAEFCSPVGVLDSGTLFPVAASKGGWGRRHEGILVIEVLKLEE